MSLDYKQLKRSIWPDLKRATKPIASRISEADKSIELMNGSIIYTASAENPDSVLGTGYHGVVLDECSRMTEDIWVRVLRPAIEDVDGWAAFISTPNGFNWFHKMFLRAGKDVSGKWAAWQRPSSDNPLMTPEKLRDAQHEVGQRAFAQEFEANFLEADGAEWSADYLPDSMWVDAWPHNPRLCVISWDPSVSRTAKSDYSAICVGKLDNEGNIYTTHDVERRDIVRTAQRIVELSITHKPDCLVIETNGMQYLLVSEIHRQAQQRGVIIPVHERVNMIEKISRIKTTLTPYLARHEIKLVGRTNGNQLWFDQAVCFPQGEHDDALDATEMCIRKMYEILCDRHGTGDGDYDTVEA